MRLHTALMRVAEGKTTSLAGSLVFGTADQPRAQQIAAGIAYFTEMREHQRQIKQAIAELEQANRRM